MRAITDRQEIARAYALFSRLVADGGTVLERMVGYQGGSGLAQLLWHVDLQMWVLLEPNRIENRYWCAFGIDDPYPASMLSITCEINPPREGIDRKCAGLFVRDESGNVFLAHSGKVGGGREGIGKTAFLESRGNDDVASVLFPDGEERDYIILGRIDDPVLRRRLADFVRSVAQFKEATARAG
ncbi:MAG: hypothetical protein HYS13_25085 [Planctomycetia bacterium]|nr:hypothetical protein [Planctomycetia bacterium]